MSTQLFSIAALTSREQIFGPRAKAIGFTDAGEIDRFLFSLYGPVVKGLPPANRLRGAIFILEPPTVPDRLGAEVTFKSLLETIRLESRGTIYAVRCDLSGGLLEEYSCTPLDRRSFGQDGWPQHVAQQLSRSRQKCVVWAMSVGVVVFLDGDIYLSSSDVVEGFVSGMPPSFQSLSWDDGAIAFHFASRELNDTSQIGIWYLPKKKVLRPKPEAIIRSKLGEFLRFRMAGYRSHSEEAHVEHEGRADLEISLVDDRLLIVEVKWIGASLVATRIAESEAKIVQELTKKSSTWFTRFDDATYVSGLKQVASYFATGKYQRAYLAVFDCAKGVTAHDSCYMPFDSAHLQGLASGDFRVLRACVDARTASVRAKS